MDRFVHGGVSGGPDKGGTHDGAIAGDDDFDLGLVGGAAGRKGGRLAPVSMESVMNQAVVSGEIVALALAAWTRHGSQGP